ncbi:MAG TPA: PilZ domain-containing protein [Terracidiphilus sp.]|nr:PilZ domain-containing protein [Terracidiphilus sp.]
MAFSGESVWDANSDDPGDHRRFPRLECGGIADVRVLPNGGKEMGLLINLSKRGCCFLADEPLLGHAGNTIEVHLKIKGTDLRLAGVIRHIYKQRRAGVEFIDICARKREQLEEVIAELAEMDKEAAMARKAAGRDEKLVMTKS